MRRHGRSCQWMEKRRLGTLRRHVRAWGGDVGVHLHHELSRKGGTSLPPKVTKTEAEWQRELTPEAYRVLRQKGTEAPFTNEYDHVFEDGVYRCAGCGAELFRSETKYDSGCGWPAFYAPASEDALETEEDKSLFMRRTEVLCTTCEGHLGHVFP